MHIPVTYTIFTLIYVALAQQVVHGCIYDMAAVQSCSSGGAHCQDSSIQIKLKAGALLRRWSRRTSPRCGAPRRRQRSSWAAGAAGGRRCAWTLGRACRRWGWRPPPPPPASSPSPAASCMPIPRRRAHKCALTDGKAVCAHCHVIGRHVMCHIHWQVSCGMCLSC